MLKMPEILAPCGSIDVFYAAVNAGCDAVYLSGKAFGARAYATNFTQEEIITALEYAHVRGVKVYLTVNTLYMNDETDSLVSFLKPLYLEGLDAVIVQDMGAFYVIRDEFPALSIHASTQMNICSFKGAEMLRNMGATRVVPARELTVPEIKEIKENVDIEVECFVHGAMCFCYSGRCLLSSFRGGRSGNRGRCAQPCRMKYDAGYSLSMKDMCTVTEIPKLIDVGIDSFKIEGRMKNEYYVASAVDAYKTLSDDYCSGHFSMDKALKYKSRLMDVFNRGGFSNGYYSCHDDPSLIDMNYPGRAGVHVADITRVGKGTIEVKAVKDIYRRDDMEIRLKEPVKLTSGKDIASGQTDILNAPETKRLKTGDKIYRTRCVKLQEDIKNELIDSNRRIPVNAYLKAETGASLSLTLVSGTVSAVSESSKPLEKSNKGTTDTSILREKVAKLGSTPFYLDKMEFDITGDPFINMSELISLRREAADRLCDSIKAGYYRYNDEQKSNSDLVSTDRRDHIEKDGTKLSILIEEEDQLRAMTDRGVTPDRLILDHSFIDDAVTLKSLKGSNIYMATPYIFRNDNPEFDDFFKKLEDLFSKGLISGIYIRNHDALAETVSMLRSGRTPLLKVILAPSLYVYNDYASLMYEELLQSDIRFVLSEEIAVDKLTELRPYKDGNAILKVYGRTVLMLSANKIKGNIKDCFIKQDDALCYNILLDETAVRLSQDKYATDFDDILIHFTNETYHEVTDVLEDYIRKCNA